MITCIVMVVTAGACLALVGGFRLYEYKVSEAFGHGVDFGKAIQVMTQDALDQIVADAGLPAREPRAAAARDIPAQRTNSDS